MDFQGNQTLYRQLLFILNFTTFVIKEILIDLKSLR